MAITLDLSAILDLDYKIETLQVEDLEIDPAVQREENRNKVLRIFKRFTPAALGVLSVSRRDDGRLIVLDGQTRRKVLLLKLPEGGPSEVECRVFYGLTRQQEALLFNTLNDNTKVRAIDQYRIAATAENPVVLEINKILDSYLFKVESGKSNGAVGAVSALQRIWADSERKGKDPNTLQLTVLTIYRAWGNSYDGMRGIILEGIAAFHDEYGSRVNFDRLVNRLKVFPGGPEGLYTAAKALAANRGMHPAMAVADLLVEKVYNKGNGTKLDVWRRRR